jgi:hypothetical protein
VLIKIGAKVVSHGRYVVFQMAEVGIPRQRFQEILRLIAELRPQPPRQHEAFDCHALKSNRQEECVQMLDHRSGLLVAHPHLASVLAARPKKREYSR